MAVDIRVMITNKEARKENKKLVLSAKELLKERRDAEVKEKMGAFKAGQVVEGTVESLKDYGAFVELTDGVTGLLHISQISNQRIKHPGVVLKEGQKVKVKILSVADGKISLSMKALEADEQEEPVDFHYESTGEGCYRSWRSVKEIEIIIDTRRDSEWIISPKTMIRLISGNR